MFNTTNCKLCGTVLFSHEVTHCEKCVIKTELIEKVMRHMTDERRNNALANETPEYVSHTECKWFIEVIKNL